MDEKKLIRVLVVDDEKPLREIVGRNLTQAGYTCIEADSGATALRVVENEPIHLALIDINMPEMDGIETLRRLKEKNPDIAVIMMTGYGTVENAVSAMKLGARDFLNKPIDLEVLPYVAEAALEQRRLIIENREYQKTLELKVEERTRQLKLSLQDLRRNFTDTIKAFTGLSERRDVHIGSHSKRVAIACRGICRRYDLSDSAVHDIEIGALLHDIGKIVIPDSLIQKSANFLMRLKLDPEDEKIIRQHPIIGQDTIEQIEILRSMGIIIRHHHEYFNGSGYPDGISGDSIPLGSRIICVADAYDNVVNTVEEKRRKIAHTIVVEHLRKKAGELYDPDVVERFFNYLAETQSQRKSTQESRCTVDELHPGMVLSRDIFTGDGIMIVPQYDTLDAGTIDRIRQVTQKAPLQGDIYVYLKVPTTIMGEKKRGLSPGTAEADEIVVSFKKVKDAIDSTSNLSTLPIIYHSAMALISDPRSLKSDIAKLLKTDQAIVTKILRIVNSALFSLSRKVIATEDAIPLLGLDEIRNIVISVSVINAFGNQKGGAFDMSEFWKHSLGCAIISKLLVKRNKSQLSSEEYFTAGLLHDIGKLVLNQLFPNEFHYVLELTNSKAMSLRNAERKVFGKSHENVGKYLLQRWKIPDILIEAVTYHHEPAASRLNPILVSTIQVSDMFAHILRIGNSGENIIPRIDEHALRNLNMSSFDIETLITGIDTQIKESEDLLLLGS